VGAPNYRNRSGLVLAAMAGRRGPDCPIRGGMLCQLGPAAGTAAAVDVPAGDAAAIATVASATADPVTAAATASGMRLGVVWQPVASWRRLQSCFPLPLRAASRRRRSCGRRRDASQGGRRKGGAAGVVAVVVGTAAHEPQLHAQRRWPPALL